MANNFRVDGVVCLVDCKYVKDHINEVRKEDTINESVTQIAFADRVLLNKIDLVSKSELKELKDSISSINSFAELIETEQSKVSHTRGPACFMHICPQQEMPSPPLIHATSLTSPSSPHVSSVTSLSSCPHNRLRCQWQR